MEKLKIMFRVLGVALVVSLLTLVTQTGGLVFVGCLPIFARVRKHVPSRSRRRVVSASVFVTLYLVATFAIVPIVAGFAGRVPLSGWGESNLRALSSWTCLLNRYYVTPELKSALERATAELAREYPGSEIAYLDASFPFFDGFPLFPHLSHFDGKKVDLAFFYRDANTDNPVHVDAPSPFGYGVFVEPRSGEPDTAERCARGGHWRYDMLGNVVPDWWKDDFVFDAERTRFLVQTLAADDAVRRMFIEPHLRQRLRLRAKVRFHGCNAVRHDDHLHVEAF